MCFSGNVSGGRCRHRSHPGLNRPIRFRRRYALFVVRQHGASHDETAPHPAHCQQCRHGTGQSSHRGPLGFQPLLLSGIGRLNYAVRFTWKTFTAVQRHVQLLKIVVSCQRSSPHCPARGKFGPSMGLFCLFPYGHFATTSDTKYSPLCIDKDKFCVTWCELPPDSFPASSVANQPPRWC